MPPSISRPVGSEPDRRRRVERTVSIRAVREATGLEVLLDPCHLAIAAVIALDQPQRLVHWCAAARTTLQALPVPSPIGPHA